MARMYPAKLDPNTKSPAEKHLFPVFRDFLSDTYTVFHGQALQAVRPSGGVDDREIDFLIAHPDYGLLAVEVKGGQITYRGDTRDWLQNLVLMKKSPVEQVKQASYDLVKLLKGWPETGGYSYPTWYALGFPDVDIPGDIAPDAPRAIVLDKRDVLGSKIAAKVEAVYKYYQRAGTTGPGEAGVAALVRKLAPTHVLRSLLSKDFETEEEQIKSLTEEQYDVLDEFDRSPHLLITGCAGSGKTMLALEKVRRLIEAKKDVLLTCYNVSLAGWLKTLLPDSEHLKIAHFHGLCVELASEAGRKLPEYSEAMGITKADYFNGILPNALRDAADTLTRRFDAIIVDEGQDFHRTFWPPLTAFLKEAEHGTFYIFSDENQRLYSRDDLPFTNMQNRHLSKNLRNTLEIGEVVGKYHTATTKYKAAGPSSRRQVEIIELHKFASPEQALEKTLDTLIAQGIKHSEIVLLTPFNDKSHWKDGAKAGKYTLARKVQPEPTQIRVETIFAFKGFERPVVILAELNRHAPAELNNLLYVGLSRARNHLVILGKLPEPGK